MTGIAAALILAVGVTTFNRDAVVAPRKNSAAVADSAAPVASAPLIELSQPDTGAARTQVSTPRAARAPTPAVPAAPAPPVVDESRLAQRRDLARAERQSTPAPLADARREAASNEAKMTVLSAGAGAPAGVAAGVAITPSRGFPSPSAGVKLEEVVVTGMKAEVSPPGTAASAEAGRLAGCYRIPSAPEERVIVGSAAKIVRLDTVRHPLGFVVRAARSDSTVGSWLRIAGDSARVDLLAAGLFRFSLKDRTACP